MDNETKRAQLKEEFLTGFLGPQPVKFEKMVGDAGNRSYTRIKSGGSSYILMDCPPDYASLRPFTYMASHISSAGLIAPNIYAQDEENGFLLLEDFGNLSAKNYISDMNDQQKYEFYCTTIDILCKLQNSPTPAQLKIYDTKLLISELELFLDWYVPLVNDRELTDSNKARFRSLWQEVLTDRTELEQTIVLRDYHTENMMILERKQLTTDDVGLLDFQDALTGSPVYDLVSILEDARINVPRALAIRLLEYFCKQKELDYEKVMLEYSLLGAQRNMRILGVFARKAIRDDAGSYLNFIPTVLEYIQYDLQHHALSKIKEWYISNVKAEQVENYFTRIGHQNWAPKLGHNKDGNLND